MLNAKAILFTVTFSLWAVAGAHAQEIKDGGLVHFSALEYLDYLPKYLLKSKSAVFVSMPEAKGSLAPMRGDWRSLSKEAHEGFIRSDIDAVAYYYLEDIYSDLESKKAFAELFERRVIKYIILLREKPPGEEKKYEIIITGLNTKTGLDISGQKAFRMEDDELSKLLNRLYLLSNQSGLERSNLLINDVPEFFDLLKIKSGQRYEAFQHNLKSDKLAVLKFANIEVPEGFDGISKGMITHYNAAVDSANARLALLMESYPYEYELVAANATNKSLRDTGFQFVFRQSYTTGINLKKMLDYERNDSETHYISIVWRDGKGSFKKYPVNTGMYKYYMMHTVTNNLYLGTKWDADVDWEKALMNHINNLKQELGVE